MFATKGPPLAAFVALLLAGGLVRAGTQQGIEAYAAKNFQLALEHFVPEVGRGDDRAAYFLAWMYFRGDGVAKDHESALRVWALQAESGFLDAQLTLARLSKDGREIARDLSAARKWYERAAVQGRPSIQFEYGRFLLYGVEGSSTELREGSVWILKAAESGYPAAQKLISSLYGIGRGVPKDLRLAYFWALLAATDGDPQNAAYRDTVERVLPATDRYSVQDAARQWRPSAAPPHGGETPRAPASSGLVTGTAFAVGASKLITNHHVVSGCTAILVDGSYRGSVERADGKNDLALVAIDGVLPSVATLRPTSAELGETVTAVGYPLQGVLSGPSATNGNVSSLAGPGGDSRLLAFTAPIQPGNSGGPLLDESGRVVGVVVSKLNALRMAEKTGDVPQNVNFAISARVLTSFLDSAGATYQSNGKAGRATSATAIVRAAQRFTFLIECTK